MNEIKRVLHVLGSMNKGGQETFIMNVYRNIDREKVQFDFLINCSTKRDDYEDEIIDLGGKIYRIPGRSSNYLKHLKELREFFNTNKQYSIVHQHTDSNVGISSIISAKKHNINKIIYHSHSSKSLRKGVFSRLFEFIYKPRIKKYATDYFACSDLAAEHLFGKYIDKTKIKIINNAIETEKFAYDENIREVKRKELGIEHKFVIGHVGRFFKVKNHAFLIDIFAEIHKQNSDAALLLVGEGKLQKEIEDKVDKLDLKDSVIFTGIRSDVNELLQAMDIFLLPSLWEGLPVVGVEAQASGLPCIISDNITKQAKITDLVEYISLEKSPLYWAERALYYHGYTRQNMHDEMKKAGFDIKDLAHWFEEFYLET